MQGSPADNRRSDPSENHVKAHKLCKLPLLVCSIPVLLVYAWCSMPVPLMDIATKSQLVVLATAIEGDGTSSAFDVVTVYRGGELLDDVSRRIHVSLDRVFDMEVPFFSGTNRQFVLFLNPSKSGEAFLPAAYGQWCLEVGPQHIALKTIEHLLETWFNPDERERVDILARDCEGSDPKLKALARQSLIYAIRSSRTPLAYKDVMLSFLTHDEPDSSSIGLSLVQGLRVEEAIPRLISMAQSPEPATVERVSLALREYRTPEVARALAALMKHPDPRVRVRAALDTDHMEEPEVIQGLVALSSDPDPEVRAMVPRGFYFHSTATWSTTFHPALLRLANDPDAHVRARALHALGDNRCWDLIPKELAIERLKRRGLTVEETRGALECLYVACSNRRDQGAKIIAANKDLLIGLVMREEDFMIGFTALGLLEIHLCPKAAAVIEEAANQHKFNEVRNYARRLLTSHTPVR